MPINADIHYKKAEQEYILADTKEKKIIALKKMISLAPSHKGSEKLRKELKKRLAKLKYIYEKEQKKTKSTKESIKKTADALVVLVGLTNSGKSSLLAALTNAKPDISEFPFTTTKPEQGVFDYQGCKIQVVEVPALKNDLEEDAKNLGIARMSDLIILITTINEETILLEEELKKAKISIPLLIVHNKSDIIPKIPSKAEISVSALTKQGIQEMKDRIFSKLNLIRVFTKEPGKKPAEKPVILKQGSTIKELAEKIHKSFLGKFNYALVWGKSAKFPSQSCGLTHVLQDKDIVELHLKK